MKSSLSAREQRTVLMGGALAVLVLWVYVAYIVGPLMREAGRLGQEVATARQQLRLLEVATANEAALREQHQQLDETVSSLRKLLPSEKELPAVIEQLSDLASQTGVKIETIFPQRPTEEQLPQPAPAAKPNVATPVVYKDVLVQIDAVAGFHQLGMFLSLVESSEEPMEVDSLRITSDPRGLKRLQIKLVIKTYFATDEEKPVSRRLPPWWRRSS